MAHGLGFRKDSVKHLYHDGFLETMDVKIRNVDEDAYCALKARAAAEGKTIGEALNEAMRAWANLGTPFPRKGSLFNIKPTDFGKGTEHLSDQIDAIVYGA